MSLEEQAKEHFQKAKQMLEYREKELTRSDRSDYVKNLIKSEIAVINFMVEQTREKLKAEGIYV